MAIKVLPQSVATDPERMRRFQQEARAIAALNHPNICQIYDVGPDYLVLEYIDGVPLQGPLPLDVSLRLMSQVISALESAHRRGILHRDLKPPNILVVDEDTAKLLDFGLAKLLDGETDILQTRPGTILGTASYMSPEQAEGRPVDVRTDVFSVGTVFYELLSGRRAFEGTTTAEVLTAVLCRELQPPPAPPDVVRVVMRCLAKAPGDRFPTMTELRAALERLTNKPSSTQASIAVLPFADMSPGKDQDWFSDGLAEEIINVLAQLPGLTVIARTSAFAFKGKNEDVRRIGEALGVAHILEGSVRRAGDRIRVTAQLITTEHGSHLWSERYDREVTDVFAIQDDIAQSIAAALQVRLSAASPTLRRREPHLAAYDLYLRGRHAWNRWTEKDVRRSVELFEQAIDRDPAYALAHAGLGLAWATLALGYWSFRPLETYPIARRALNRALELDPDIAEAYSWLGLIDAWFDFDWASAGNRHSRAIQLNPNSASAHDQCGVWLTALGRHVEAAQEYEEACRLDPLSGFFLANAGLGAYRARNYDQAASWFQRQIALDPALPMGYGFLGLVHVHQGSHTSALEASARAVQLSGGEMPWRALEAYVCASCGEHDRARESLRELEARRAHENIWLVALAMAYANLGEVDIAFERLEQAVRERLGWVAWLGVEPGLDPLRQDPRFPLILGSVGLSLPT